MRIKTRFAYSTIIVFCIMFVSCSEQNISVKITQHTDPAYVTGIAKYNGYLWCATKGGLIKWDIPAKEYTLITSADGLPSNILTDVAVDGENTLWVSSREGLGAFGGSSWKRYGVSHGLPSPEINDLAVDKYGKLWVATADGAAIFERDRFKLLAEEGSPGRKIINCIYFDRGDNTWIGTENNGIYYNIDDEWKQTGTGSDLGGNSSSKIIVQAWNLRIWSSSKGGIYLWDGTGWGMFSSIDKMGVIEAKHMASTDDRLWFFTSSGVYSSHTPDLIHYTTEDGLLTDDVTTGVVESDTKIYVGTSEGLSIIDEGDIENYVVSNTPVGNNFISISIDDRNRVWVGSWETGLSLYDSGNWTILTGENPKTLATVRSTIFGPDGKIVFNTTNGVVFYQGRNWKTYTRKEGISGDDVRCGVFDRKGRYWIGTSAGICYFDNDRWRRFRKFHGLPSEDVWACGVDADDTVWFGTTEGIVSFTEDELLVRTAEIDLEEVDVRSILVKDDIIYFGTNSGNLIAYDGDTWDVYGSNYLKTEKSIYSIASEPSGALWFGTNGDGIIRLENGKTTKFTMADDGIPFDVVRSVAFNDGVLWAACYGGVVSIELETVEE